MVTSKSLISFLFVPLTDSSVTSLSNLNTVRQCKYSVTSEGIKRHASTTLTAKGLMMMILNRPIVKCLFRDVDYDEV